MYDCIIIGGGLAGLTCGIKCAKEGLRTAIFSGGMNSLHFSSGSIDILGYSGDREVITKPFKYLKKLKKKNPDHPYSKIPEKIIRESLEFIGDELSGEDLALYHDEDLNHFRMTALGVLKPTFLSQESIFNEKMKDAIEKKTKIAILNFEGFRDFYPELALGQLKKNSLLKNVDCATARIKLPFFSKTKKDLLESSSIDIARVFETEKFLPSLAEEIKAVAGDAGIVYLPAFIGLNNHKRIHKRLSELTGLIISEVPTLPPSILGMRIDSALKARFNALGGEFIAGDKVTGGEIAGGKVDYVCTANYGDSRHGSGYFVLSTGSFLSGCLHSQFNLMNEPVFKLKLDWKKSRSQWYSEKFFDPESHPFLSFGVNTDRNFNPYDRNGDPVKNLFCAGSVLSGYNPIKEGSGGGVAVSTGYFAAQKIIKAVKG